MLLADPERFWSRVDKNGPVVRPELGPCWLWTGARKPNGYGHLKVGQRWIGAHRVAYMLSSGVVIDRHQLVCHRCDTPLCCNPDHFFIGDNAANAADKVQKGRQARGEKIRFSKLTEEQVEDIKARIASGQSQSHVGRVYGMNQATISRINRGLIWPHVDPHDHPADAARVVARDLLVQLETGQDEQARGSVRELVRILGPLYARPIFALSP